METSKNRNEDARYLASVSEISRKEPEGSRWSVDDYRSYIEREFVAGPKSKESSSKKPEITFRETHPSKEYEYTEVKNSMRNQPFEKGSIRKKVNQIMEDQKKYTRKKRKTPVNQHEHSSKMSIDSNKLRSTQYRFVERIDQFDDYVREEKAPQTNPFLFDSPREDPRSFQSIEDGVSEFKMTLQPFIESQHNRLKALNHISQDIASMGQNQTISYLRNRIGVLEEKILEKDKEVMNLKSQLEKNIISPLRGQEHKHHENVLDMLANTSNLEETQNLLDEANYSINFRLSIQNVHGNVEKLKAQLMATESELNCSLQREHILEERLRKYSQENNLIYKKLSSQYAGAKTEYLGERTRKEQLMNQLTELMLKHKKSEEKSNMTNQDLQAFHVEKIEILSRLEELENERQELENELIYQREVGIKPEEYLHLKERTVKIAELVEIYRKENEELAQEYAKVKTQLLQNNVPGQESQFNGTSSFTGYDSVIERNAEVLKKRESDLERLQQQFEELRADNTVLKNKLDEAHKIITSLENQVYIEREQSFAPYPSDPKENNLSQAAIDMEKEIIELRKELLIAKDGNNQAYLSQEDSKLKELNDQLIYANSEITRIEAENKRLGSINTDLLKNIQSLENKVKIGNSSNLSQEADKSVIQEKDSTILSLREKLNESENDFKTLLEQNSHFNLQISEYEKQIESLKSEIKSKDGSSKEMIRLSWRVKYYRAAYKLYYRISIRRKIHIFLSALKKHVVDNTTLKMLVELEEKLQLSEQEKEVLLKELQQEKENSKNNKNNRGDKEEEAKLNLRIKELEKELQEAKAKNKNQPVKDEKEPEDDAYKRMKLAFTKLKADNKKYYELLLDNNIRIPF